MHQQPIRIVIADDHPAVCQGLRKALATDAFDVVGEARHADELLALLDREACDVVITDYSMPHGDAPDNWCLVAALTSRHPDLPLLIYSEFVDSFLMGSLAQWGVQGLVSKRDDIDEITRAVNRLAMGGRYRSPVVRAAIDAFESEPLLQRFTGLTRREMEVAGLMLSGASVVDMSRLLGRSVNTVSTQKTSACRRLGFAGEREVFRFVALNRLSLKWPETAVAAI